MKPPSISWSPDATTRQRIPFAMLCDQFRLRKRMRDLSRQKSPSEQDIQKLQRELERSIARRQERQAKLPRVEIHADLPIGEAADEIAQAMQQHQALVVCGETGSGKSTQLPKICLQLGRGVAGMIGHTQPRRLAARAVAARIAEELKTPLGEQVGFKIRFTESVRRESYIKLMTDGILLAETQSDRFLEQYDTIILDEAHERSLNIDFLMGYLKRLLPKRPELRLIITSATIDAERFSEHFANDGVPAPIIEISGRGYPIDTWYRPLVGETEQPGEEIPRGIIAALEELHSQEPGDVLVFLPTERDIRETAKRLRNWTERRGASYDILPLYARLPQAEQARVFSPGKRPRIVLATNVAESTLTVPRVRYVIDEGTARISRHVGHSQIQRLRVEPISQASADQRQGRCGRVGPGICVRLYSEEDYASRPSYTTPEIRRTDLSSVILRMLALGLGEVSAFPFLDRPSPDAVQKAYRTLFELKAIDENRRITQDGRLMSRLPVHPRVARILLVADELGCLADILIIVTALEINDPRLRPAGKEQQADEAHAAFADKSSDFLAYLHLWNFLKEQAFSRSRSALRRICQRNFLSYNHIRDWRELHRQMLRMVAECGLKLGEHGSDPSDIHKALLPGLLSNVAMRFGKHAYRVPGGAEVFIWPGSRLFAAKPKCIVAAEMVETSRNYLRTVARVSAEWIEPIAAHLITKSHRDPHWSRRHGTVFAFEQVKLGGLVLCPRRRVRFGPIDAGTSRHLFLQRALVEGELEGNFEFLRRNRALVLELAQQAAKTRDERYLVPDATLYAFYDERIPPEVWDAATLRRWLKGNGRQFGRELTMRREELIDESLAGEANPHAFPPVIQAGPLKLDVDYRFDPRHEHDGLAVSVPRHAFHLLDTRRLEWLVPGLLQEKLIALIRSLPKLLRRGLVPAPDAALRAAGLMEYGKGPFLPTAAAAFTELSGQRTDVEDFQLESLPGHLSIHVRVLDEKGEVAAEGRDLDALRRQLGISEVSDPFVMPDDRWHLNGLTTWSFGELPASVEIKREGYEMAAYPALLDRGDSVSLRLFADQAAAIRATRAGVVRLCRLQVDESLMTQLLWLPKWEEIQQLHASHPVTESLEESLLSFLAGRAFVPEETFVNSIPRCAQDFEDVLVRGKERISLAVQDLVAVLEPILRRHYGLRQQLSENNGPRWNALRADIEEQLESLFAPGFFLHTTWKQLQHFPRYLQAIDFRLEQLPSRGWTWDESTRAEVEHFAQLYRERHRQHEQRGVFDPRLEEFRWMLEEFRVSLFAQRLGTAVKVSPQRLERQWAKVRF